MKSVVLALVVAAVGCDRTEARDPQPATKPAVDSPPSTPGKDKDEQDRFDRERRPDLIVAALGIRPGSHVADIGAGSGLLTVHLARAVMPDGKVVATDIDKVVLDLLAARTRAAGVDPVIERRVVKETVPGLEAGAFDAILLSEVDNYFDDPVAWLVAAMPALKPGGRIVITNRIDRKRQSLAAAAKAGLVMVTTTSPEPTHFIAVYNRP